MLYRPERLGRGTCNQDEVEQVIVKAVDGKQVQVVFKDVTDKQERRLLQRQSRS